MILKLHRSLPPFHLCSLLSLARLNNKIIQDLKTHQTQFETNSSQDKIELLHHQWSPRRQTGSRTSLWLHQPKNNPTHHRTKITRNVIDRFVSDVNIVRTFMVESVTRKRWTNYRSKSPIFKPRRPGNRKFPSKIRMPRLATSLIALHELLSRIKNPLTIDGTQIQAQPTVLFLRPFQSKTVSVELFQFEQQMIK